MPGAHAPHVVAPVTLACPGAQLLQTASPALAAEPGAHGTHTTAPGLHAPSWQTVHPLSPASDRVPGEHGVHAPERNSCPAGQSGDNTREYAPDAASATSAALVPYAHTNAAVPPAASGPSSGAPVSQLRENESVVTPPAVASAHAEMPVAAAPESGAPGAAWLGAFTYWPQGTPPPGMAITGRAGYMLVAPKARPSQTGVGALTLSVTVNVKKSAVTEKFTAGARATVTVLLTPPTRASNSSGSSGSSSCGRHHVHGATACMAALESAL